MSIDEELRKLKREGAEPAKLIIAKLRVGILSKELIGLAASLGHGGAVEACKRLNFQVYPNSRVITDVVILNVAEEIDRITLQKQDNSIRRIMVSYGCDVAEHVLPLFEAVSDDGRPRTVLNLARKWAAGAKVARSTIIAARQDAYDAYMHARPMYAAAGSAMSVINACDAQFESNEFRNVSQACDYIGNALSHARAAIYDSVIASGEIEAQLWDSTQPCAARSVERDWQRFRLAEYALGDI